MMVMTKRSSQDGIMIVVRAVIVSRVELEAEPKLRLKQSSWAKATIEGREGLDCGLGYNYD